jgi:hypothetical protein
MQDIDITPGDAWQEITTPVDEGDGVINTYIFELKWNVWDSSWYLSLYEADGTIIITGKRVVLGTYIGRRSRHPLLRKGVLVAVDTTRTGTEATLDDLGTRVKLRYFTTQEVMVGRNLNSINDGA